MKMHSALLVEIIIVVLKIEFSYSSLKNLGEVIDDKHSSDPNVRRCFVDPRQRALRLEDNSLNEGLGIAGGHKASNSEFPYNVIFINFGGVCAGSILSNQFVLTSAHCLDFNRNKQEMTVYAGARFIFDRNADVHKIQEFAIHDRYNKPIRYANDAALLKIQDKFHFKATVRPTELITNEKWMVRGTMVQVAGWGESVPGTSRVSEELKSIDLKLLSRSECKKTAGTPLSPDMFCLWGDGERATCLGDSGAGAFWNNKLVGIVSHGGACGQFPGVYTNVAHLRSWIKQTSKKLNSRFNRYKHLTIFGEYV